MGLVGRRQRRRADGDRPGAAGPRIPAPLVRGSILTLGNDRLIATARLILVVLGLMALWIDPEPRAVPAHLAPALFFAYLLAALAILSVDFRAPLLVTERARILQHAVDLVFLSLVVYFTSGTTRAFFGFFVFLMLVAHIRWQSRGTLWTAVIALLAYASIKLLVSPTALGRPEFDDLLMRLGYIAVVAALLIYLGRAQEAAAGRMLMAASWPTSLAPERALSAYLAHAAGLLAADRLLLIWFAEREPYAELVFWSDGAIRSKRPDRDLIEAWCGPDREYAPVFYWDARTRRTTTVEAGERRTVERPPFPAALLRGRGLAGVLGIPFAADSGHGCLLAVRAGLGADDVVLADIIAARFRAWAAEGELARELDEGRARQQRMELASDLHDGVLQTLAGTSLQLRSLRRAIEDAAPQAASRIDSLAAALASAHADLRSMLHDLAPRPPDAEPDQVLGEELARLSQEIERRWPLRMEWRLDPPQAAVSSFVGHQLAHLVTEAAANAVRHSGATRLRVCVDVQPADILVSVENDRGAAGKAAASFEPRMLRIRLDHLGGTLRVQPADDHVRLEMAFPAREARVA